MLFNTSIRENILMGNRNATDEMIWDVLAKANAKAFVEEQPDGLNTHVGAGGNQMSGGQKQRLALARALIRNPKMFIFDEATSALDKANEQAVQEAINNIKGVTVIVIAHRLSTVRDADKIIVMGKGVMKEEGSHDQLLKQYPDGAYAKLVANEKKLGNTANAAVANQGAAAVSAKGNQEALQNLYDQKMIEANEIRDKKQKELDEKLAPVLDPKQQEGTFQKKLWEYNKPVLNILIGALFQIVNGFAGPVAGILIIKCMFAMIMYHPDADELNKELEEFNMDPVYFNSEKMNDEMRIWLLAMVGVALLTGLMNFFSKFMFS